MNKEELIKTLQLLSVEELEALLKIQMSFTKSELVRIPGAIKKHKSIILNFI